jgi:hypothetical protein
VQHIIKKQIIQLQLDGKQDAFHIQHLISEYYWKEVIPILQKVFDSISKPGEIIRMDQLEIDLGVISLKDIEEGKWAANLELVLKEQLTKFLSKIHECEEIRKEPATLSVFKQWLYYMKNGYLPWNTVEINETWYQKTLQTLATDFESISAVRKQILTNPSFTIRVIAQHSDHFLTNMIETLTAEKQENLLKAIDELYEVFYLLSQKAEPEINSQILPIGNKKDFARKLWEIALTASSKNDRGLKTEVFIEKVLQAYLQKFKTLKFIKKELAEKLAITKPVLKKLVEAEKNKSRKDESEKTQITKGVENQKKLSSEKKQETRELPKEQKVRKHSEEKSNQEKKANPDKLNKTENGSTVESGLNQKISTEEDQIDDQDKILEDLVRRDKKIGDLFREESGLIKNSAHDSLDEEGVFIRHAGVVLLHPFLNSFFKILQLTHENEFVNIIAHQKALHLLHFLSTGHTHPKEYELVIAKVLCAYPLHQPVEIDIELTEIELAEANDLLAATIAQWKVLINSSAPALQEGFLQRNGKLFSKNDKLYLQVEKSAIDVLLDRLPWNLSMIRLPWMNEMLRVEWR